MDWIKLVKPKIHNRIEFFFFIPVLIVLILLILIFINAFSFSGKVHCQLLKQIIINRDFYWAPDSILIAVFTLLVLWVSVVLGWVLGCAKKLILSPSEWKLEENFEFECFNNLDIQGKVTAYDKNVKLTSSAAGILLKNNYWVDFKINFKFNFEKLKLSREVDWARINGKIEEIRHMPQNNFFGFLFRAQDLDNYFMISLGIKQVIKKSLKSKKISARSYNKRFLITPHIKVDGR